MSTPTLMRQSGGRALRGLILLLTTAAACHRASAGVDETPEVVELRSPTLTVRVVNHSQLDATIYIAHDGVRERLGSVTAATTVSFAVRRRTLTGGDFALVADPIGSLRTATSERLPASLGDLYIWTLESDFSHNSVQVQE